MPTIAAPLNFTPVAILPPASSHPNVVMAQGGKLWWSDGSTWSDLGAAGGGSSGGIVVTVGQELPVNVPVVANITTTQTFTLPATLVPGSVFDITNSRDSAPGALVQMQFGAGRELNGWPGTTGLTALPGESIVVIAESATELELKTAGAVGPAGPAGTSGATVTSSVTPSALSATAAIGSSAEAARADHVHPITDAGFLLPVATGAIDANSRAGTLSAWYPNNSGVNNYSAWSSHLNIPGSGGRDLQLAWFGLGSTAGIFFRTQDGLNGWGNWDEVIVANSLRRGQWEIRGHWYFGSTTNGNWGLIANLPPDTPGRSAFTVNGNQDNCAAMCFVSGAQRTYFGLDADGVLKIGGGNLFNGVAHRIFHAGNSGHVQPGTANGQVPVWNHTMGRYEPGTVSGGGGSPGGATTQVQYNNGGAFDGATNILVNADETLRLNSYFDVGMNSGTPATPGAQILRHFVRHRAGRMLPAVVGPSGISTALQAALYGNTISMWTPSTGTTVSGNFGTSWTARNAGTGAAQSHPNPTFGVNNALALGRANFGTGTTATGSSGIQSARILSALTTTAGQGGFFFQSRFMIEGWDPGIRLLIGMSALNAALNAEPSGLANTIALVKDQADSNFFIASRNASAGTRTNTNVAAIDAANNVFEFFMFAAPGQATTVNCMLVNAITGAVLYEGAITATLPTTNTGLFAHAQIQSTSGTTAKNLGLNKLYIETDL